MRPLQLSFSGLRSYPNECPAIDFTDKTLIGILGDTGAGKSTILEALCVALYGNSGSDVDVRDLIADSCPTMTVDLTFHHSGHTWRVRRAYHTNSRPSSHLLENLDTGKKIDNARPINKTIAAVLGLRYEAFRASVLLPQGKFAELLHATGSGQTKLLKGLFEVDLVETVRDRARDRAEALSGLVHQAELARKRLRDDPAAAAEAARRRAETASLLAARLSDTLAQLRTLQEDLRDARTRHGALEQTSVSLSTTAKATVATALRRLDRVADAIAQLADAAQELARRETQAKTDMAAAQAALRTAAEAGDTPESLARAHAQLSAVPQQLTDLADTKRRLAAEDERLAAESARLTATDKQIGLDAEHVTQLAHAAEQAKTRAEQARAAAESIEEQLKLALDAAAAAASAAAAEQQARTRADEAEAQLPDLFVALQAARASQTEAAAALAELQRAESAAAAGAHVHAGDPCPVCIRELPAEYVAPAPADPNRLAKAADSNTKAAEHAVAAERQHAAATSTADAERTRANERAADLREAAERLSRELAPVRAAFDHRALAAVPEGPTLDTATLRQHLAKAVAAIVSGDGDRRRNTRRATTKRLMAAPNEVVSTLEQDARRAAEKANTAQHALATSRKLLRRSQTTCRRDRQRLEDDLRRRQEAESRLRKTLRALPPSLQTALPDPENEMPTAQQITQAHQILSTRRKQIDEHALGRDNANASLEQVGQQRLALAARTTEEVTNPIQTLLRDLSPVAHTVQHASTLLGPTGTPPPTDPQDATLDKVRGYATQMDSSITRSLDAVAAEMNAAGAAIDRIGDRLTTALTAALTEHVQAAALASEDGGAEQAEALVPVPPTDITDPSGLDPLTEAIAGWRNKAAADQREQREAIAQIPQAKRLDEAIAPARLRLAALTELRAHLTEAKFLHYLINQRTYALLGIASDIFGRLSAGEFGFTDDFQVAVRRSQVTRSPRTLSGGETFLGSLALSLALVELYSRSGGRLGALFLDEGFDALDADNLATALSVLRQEAGPDKLVAVITHIHSVAEAVDDVLWVEKGIAGSVASWLDPEERERLVRDDVAAGLLSLTS